MQRRITILGATGSIGVSTLDVIARHPERFRLHAITAHRNRDLLLAQCLAQRPAFAVIEDSSAAEAVREALRAAGCDTVVLSGRRALSDLAASEECDTVVAGIVGAAGLEPTLAAVRAGKRVLLANKEALVMAGPVFMQAVRDHGAELLPLDSEHNAIFQCLPSTFRPGELIPPGVRRILLTASGGPFRTLDPEAMASVTPDQACAHPNWDMGRKISVDSATMMNKGLELIEACWLFDVPGTRVDVVVHPQSVVHSLVDFDDGSVLAQLGNPDMRTPIAHALGFPERLDAGVAPLDLMAIARLDFEAPDMQRFPCLRLAYQALASGGTACATLNAANEVAVAAFLNGRIRFNDIAVLVERCLDQSPVQALNSLEDALAADAGARQLADALLPQLEVET
ncbi:1-deoxy-D-xylulose-5-phosphate reductoisomerase [Methylonatrum kenyense]|uniref:1-deoxy-D-xylulose-5-phosphate reductoisomerase n=1 Tax=Methylonatrum kenyense TaxID=455253 RepID=UPI0020C13644|nr:1-deoxy-D-xylulose-5-phosphate reductoisomerase [Methylonatrum kenyense]MCK8516378.1 1-deoxy-D-xylulose-5-phosphate reductoisomerase [Methylonatrum kenyense]